MLKGIHDLETDCEQNPKTLEEEIGKFEARHDEANALLAESTGDENSSAEMASEKGEEHTELETATLKSRTECSAKVRRCESELCALKKIRGELFKLKGDKHPFFQNCEVSKWEPEDCSSSCGGGIQFLNRAIVSPPSGGSAECPPRSMRRACNEQP